ncbi:MAG: tRNA pseudouridine(38-40) synthase TruA [Spirochaetes bacterium]|nr:tRNA pseudouridine(38-40) synthase TruA [Spirochaetota bacterium]
MESERTFKLTLAYDGSAFKGWQRLPGKARTVQGTVEAALARIVAHEVEIAGSGRTDSGVHADGQVASVRLRTSLAPERLRLRLNAELSDDAVCLAFEEADPRFHARYHAIGKTYRYLVRDAPLRDPFTARYAHHVPARLDLDAMRAAGEVLVGKHDFSSFTNLKPGEKSFERELRSVAVDRSGDIVGIVFTADGFLYNQARIMAGALIEAGLGRLSPGRLREILDARDRSLAPGAAPAHGLRLESVRYG